MNRELILAALDGKTLQYRYTGNEVWTNFTTASSAVAFLAGGQGRYACRIKPIPIPDKVIYRVMGKLLVVQLPYSWTCHGTYKDHTSPQICSQILEDMQLKITIKTDENGKETKHVEIVE